MNRHDREFVVGVGLAFACEMIPVLAILLQAISG
jgi:hypothetical protein